MQFEWDRAKDEANRRQHGISFQQVKELFTSGVEYLEIFDREHSHDEDRFIAVGPIARGVVLVVYTERQESVVRIISARRATRAESRLFRQHVEGKPALALLRIAARHPRVLTGEPGGHGVGLALPGFAAPPGNAPSRAFSTGSGPS